MIFVMVCIAYSSGKVEKEEEDTRFFFVVDDGDWNPVVDDEDWIPLRQKKIGWRINI